MKRTPKILFAAIALLGVLYGAMLLFTSFRPFGVLASFETKAADLGGRARVAFGLAESTAPQAARSIQSNLASVSLAVHEVVPKAEGWGGALTEVDGAVVVVDKAGKLFQWLGGSKTMELAARVPMEIDTYRANLPGKPWDHWDSRTHFRVLDALGRRTDDGYELLVTHNYWHADRNAKSVRLSVIRFKQLSDIGAGEWETLLECQPLMEAAPQPSPFTSNESGGRIAALDDGHILVVFGSHLYGTKGWPVDPLETTNCYGRALLIDTATGSVKLFARGLRNPQGLFIDSGGRVWETEHGPRGGDELNLLEAGIDYGWPHVTYGTAPDSAAYFTSGAKAGVHDGYREPVFAWVPSVGIANLIRIESSPAVWAGDLLVSSMKGMVLHRVRIRDGRAILTEPIPLGFRVRDLLQVSDGRILAWTDSGEIVELTVKALALLKNGGAGAGVAETRGTLAICMSCHSLSPGDHSGGPSLHGVIGRRIAATQYAQYSPALRARPGEWTADDLRQYLRNPGAFVPGTTMPDLDLSESTIDDIIAELEAVSKEH